MIIDLQKMSIIIIGNVSNIVIEKDALLDPS
jgi:hypothetical protein